MNNYTRSQQLLHRLALSSSFLREALFDLEKRLFFKENSVSAHSHVFIAGMARSGTTTLLNALYQTNLFASLSYADMPFVLSPNLWAKFNKGVSSSKPQVRAHGDGIEIDNRSPEAFEEVFWQTFDQQDPSTLAEFSTFISLVLKKAQKARYLSKNNQNIQRIALLAKHYPDAKFIIPFREPRQHCFSLLSQHQKFCSLQREEPFVRKYMFWIGHREFGLDYCPSTYQESQYTNTDTMDHWLEQWLGNYQNLQKFSEYANVQLVCYEDLCTDKQVWSSLLRFIEVDQATRFDFRKSEKEIGLPCDTRLFERCTALYQQLRNLQ